METNDATELWPWFALIGLGMFHGLNPAMGWLFSVALGLHRRSRGIVLLSLLPIALGHATAIAAVAAFIVILGGRLDQGVIREAAGLLLIAWSLYLLLYGHRQRVRVGLQTGMAGLVLWSFLMATAHGAGLMLVPVLIPLCLAGTPGSEILAGDSLLLSLAAVAVHTLAMLAMAGLFAIVVFEWLGVVVLRRGWINLDLLWALALAGTGAVLLLW